MSKNIGFSKRIATEIAELLNNSFIKGQYFVSAFPQREDSWPRNYDKEFTHQYVVVIQKQWKKS